MKKKAIKDYARFIPGINQSRIEKQKDNKIMIYYDQASFDADYNHDYFSTKEMKGEQFDNNITVNEGDIVLSNSLLLATMVSNNNDGKVLSLNFTKVKFNGDELDKLYFLYLYNAYRDVKIQKEKMLQRSGAILRVPIRFLEQIMIPIVSLEEQKKIGKIYMETLKLQSKLNRQSELFGEFTNLVLSEKLKEGK